jgi:Ras-related protein Rab-2A
MMSVHGQVRTHIVSPGPSLNPGVLGFTNTRTWLKDVRQHADPHLTCILVGNKVDLCSDDAGPHKRNREVTTEEAELFAKEEGLLFVEASAKSGQNVEVAFEQATKDILAKIRNGVFDDDRVRHRSHFSQLHAHLAHQSPGVKTSKPNTLTLDSSTKSSCC